MMAWIRAGGVGTESRVNCEQLWVLMRRGFFCGEVGVNAERWQHVSTHRNCGGNGWFF